MMAHKIRLHTNQRIEQYFAQACGVSRFAFNWALIEWQKMYQCRKEILAYNEREEAIALWHKDAGIEYEPNPYMVFPNPNERRMREILNKQKRDFYPWMLEVTKCAPQQAIKDLGREFKNFFEGRAKYPKLKKKHKSNDSFYLDNTQLKIKVEPQIKDGKKTGKMISSLAVPKLGWVRMFENIRFPGKIMSVVISREADKWYASFTIDTKQKPVEHDESVFQIPRIYLHSEAVDLGLKVLATLAGGLEIPALKALRASEEKVKRLQRKLSKKVKGSRNYEKARIKLARAHARVANQRKDCLHKATTFLAKTYAVIGVETLNVKGMMKNHSLAKSIADAGWGEFIRQLLYKAKLYGARVVRAGRFYPSSKTCSCCGHTVRQLPLKIREWECSECGTRHHRDQNAAINLLNNAVSCTVSG